MRKYDGIPDKFKGLQRKDVPDIENILMGQAILWSKMSKDPSTQVGACIVGDDNRILSIGYNGTPNGFKDEFFPWDREGLPLETKYMYVCHAELNAVLNYRGSRKELENAILYVDLFPCNECAKIISQSGIREVVYLRDKYADTDSVIASKRLFDACGIKYRNIQLSNNEISIKI